jgi:hypothetical protein
LLCSRFQTELVKVRRETGKTKLSQHKNELFPGANKKDLISTSALRPPSNKGRTDSPAAGGSRYFRIFSFFSFVALVRASQSHICEDFHPY